MSDVTVKAGNDVSESDPSAWCEGLLCVCVGGGVTKLNTQGAGELPFTHSSDPG